MKRIKSIITALLVLTSTFSYSQDFPTRGEIYDYEIGDVFHRINSESGGYYGSIDWGDSIFIVQEIVDKYYSSSFDTVFYQIFVQKLEHYFFNPENNNYSEYYVNIDFKNLDSLLLGEEIIEDESLFNGRKTVQNTFDYGGGTYEETYVTHRWTVGCGYTLYSWYRWRWDILMGEYDIHELVYFKKGEEEWGEAQTIVGLDEINTDSNTHIYPNPASDYINIPVKENSTIQIYNSTGQLFVNQIANSDITQLDISAFPGGVYIVNLLDEEGQNIGKSKFLKL